MNSKAADVLREILPPFEHDCPELWIKTVKDLSGKGKALGLAVLITSLFA